MNMSVACGSSTPSYQRLFEALSHEPQLGMSLMTASGDLLWSNPQAVDMLWGDSAAQARDAEEPTEPVDVQSLGSIWSKACADEFLRLIGQAISTGEPIIVRAIRGGRRVQLSLRPVEASGSSERQLLIVARPGEHDLAEAEADVTIIEFPFVDWGPLDRLTRRELEVLARYARGDSTQAIGEDLELSPKTIESYKSQIRIKMNIRSRSVLTRMALTSGLAPSHVHLPRWPRQD